MKKYFKKIGALLIAVMMLVAMAVPVSAATITINNADTAEKYMVQVIEADPTSATGWKFKNGETEFKEALGVTDAQAAIAKLIKMVNPSATLPSAYSEVPAATEAQLQTALSNMTINGEFKTEVTNAGMYAIRATETGYTYQDMAVYVDFEGKTTPPSLEAKKSTTVIKKEITNEGAKDQAVAIGDSVEYKVTSNFPYVKPNSENKTYIITDTLTGAEYDQQSVEITIGGTKIENVTPVFDAQANTLKVDLSDYIKANNENANKPVVITYSATVTKTSVNNKVEHTGDNITGSDDKDVYTGTITLTKNGENNKKLSGAGFNVKLEEKVLTFVQDTDADGNAVAGKYTYDPKGTITEVVTGTDGTLEVKGLDEGKYHFAEVTAPDGYSINEEGADATLTATKTNNVATAAFATTTELKDTKLSALPSTGSVGTYLFTIIGVGIMAVMVCLFTIKRRRDA